MSTALQEFVVCDFLFKPCVVLSTWSKCCEVSKLDFTVRNMAKHVNTCSETAAEKYQKEQLHDKHQCILKSNSICAASTLNVSITCYRGAKGFRPTFKNNTPCKTTASWSGHSRNSDLQKGTFNRVSCTWCALKMSEISLSSFLYRNSAPAEPVGRYVSCCVTWAKSYEMSPFSGECANLLHSRHWGEAIIKPS